METIEVLIKEPGKEPELIETENTHEALQALVGGNIEFVTVVPDRLVMLVDDEGKMKGKKGNFFFSKLDDFIVGTAVFLGTDGEEFASIPGEFAEEIPGIIPIIYTGR